MVNNEDAEHNAPQKEKHAEFHKKIKKSGNRMKLQEVNCIKVEEHCAKLCKELIFH